MRGLGYSAGKIGAKAFPCFYACNMTVNDTKALEADRHRHKEEGQKRHLQKLPPSSYMFSFLFLSFVLYIYPHLMNNPAKYSKFS